MEACNLCEGAVRKCDVDEVIYPKWLLNQENSMEQSFMNVLQDIEHDLNVVDDAFLILVKEYFVDEETSEILFYRVKEIIRGDPIFMRIVSDKRGVRGGRYKVCPIHRDQVSYPGQDDPCQVCGSKMEDAHYVNMAGSGKTQYYLRARCCRTSWFSGRCIFRMA